MAALGNRRALACTPRRAGAGRPAARRLGAGPRRLGPLDHALETLEDELHVRIGIHDLEQPVVPVVLDQGFGLRLVDLEPLADDLFLVVRTLDQARRFTALLAVYRPLRGRGVYVEYPAAVLADAPAGQAFEQHAEIEVHEDHGLERFSQFCKQRLQSRGLRQIARVAVQDEALGRVGLRQPLAYHP